MAQQEQFGQVVLDQASWQLFQRAIRLSADANLPKRIGQANKEIGSRFISEWLHPRPESAAVGEGTGAAVRPSASKREVKLMVGGAHRSGRSPERQWGRRVVRPFQSAPARPFIRGSVDRHEDEIRNAWLEAISEAMDPAFHTTEP